jgi:hypothetical protein
VCADQVRRNQRRCPSGHPPARRTPQCVGHPRHDRAHVARRCARP